MSSCSVLTIDLNKIRENTNQIVRQCRDKRIEVIGVTKGFTAAHQIVTAMLEGGIAGLADARMENIMELRKRGFQNQITLLRLPRLSNVDNVVRYADVSINSELSVISALAAAACRIEAMHKIILMVDVGDLREGVLQEHVIATAAQIKSMRGVKLVGLGTNMGCYGGVLPSSENLGVLITLRDLLEQYLDYKLDVISGGGTSSLFLVEKDEVPEGINQLRIGEGILLGTDTTNNRVIPGLHQDAFRLRGEVIEVKDKPSLPMGEIGKDAFGNTPQFIDQGTRKRAILAFGRQDIYIEGIRPVEEKYAILGASSDHTIVDITDGENEVKVGDEIEFSLTYPGLLSASDSRYVEKEFKGERRNED